MTVDRDRISRLQSRHLLPSTIARVIVVVRGRIPRFACIYALYGHLEP